MTGEGKDRLRDAGIIPAADDPQALGPRVADKPSGARCEAVMEQLSNVERMAATLSHELSQPLSSAANYLAVASNLMQRPDAAAGSGGPGKYMTLAARQLAFAMQLIGRIRSFVCRGELEPAESDAAHLLRETIELMHPDLLRLGIHLRISIADDLPRDLMIDPVQIQQVFRNVIRNAADAMRDAVRRELTVSAYATRTHVVFRVEDSGPGIHSAIRDRVFVAGVSGKRDGMGVGLAICQAIVAAHGGTILASASAAGGAAITIALPNHQPRREASDDAA